MRVRLGVGFVDEYIPAKSVKRWCDIICVLHERGTLPFKFEGLHILQYVS